MSVVRDWIIISIFLLFTFTVNTTQALTDLGMCSCQASGFHTSTIFSNYKGGKFYESIRGEKGDVGRSGEPGPEGHSGEIGEIGARGPPAFGLYRHAF
ncbi:unnamed protein product [Clavelina lepadiformis]|uniref:Uncharacterized protein n=1 Tax=Clavelina lepadiformis TaxID=159417 RepID=A0ABP0FWX7_CLALP